MKYKIELSERITSNTTNPTNPTNPASNYTGRIISMNDNKFFRISQCNNGVNVQSIDITREEWEIVKTKVDNMFKVMDENTTFLRSKIVKS